MVVRNVICFFSIYQLYLHEQLAESRLMKVFCDMGLYKSWVCLFCGQSILFLYLVHLILWPVGLALQQVALQPF